MKPETIKNGALAADNPELNDAVMAYAKKIYPLLLRRCDNREVAMRVLAELLTDMYRAVQTTELSDPLEAALYRRAELMQDDILGQCIRSELCDSINSLTAEPLNELEPAEMTLPSGNSDAQEPQAAPQLFETDSTDDAIAVLTRDPVPTEDEPPWLDTSAYDYYESGAYSVHEEQEPIGYNESDSNPEPYRKTLDIFSIFIMILLIIGIAAMLWVIAGLFMNYGFLPKIDLGYRWFSMNIAPWF